MKWLSPSADKQSLRVLETITASRTLAVLAGVVTTMWTTVGGQAPELCIQAREPWACSPPAYHVMVGEHGAPTGGPSPARSQRTVFH